MNDEQRFLISLTSDFINGNNREYDNDIDIDSVMKTAGNHNLFALAYCTLKNGEKNSAAFSQKLHRYEKYFLNIVFMNNVQMQVLEELKSLLSRAEIRFVPFKGAKLRFLYPIPESRIMGDIDILIDLENRKKVKTLLESNGYVCKNSNGPVWDYEKNGVLFEIHTNILNGKAGASNTINKYFSNAINEADYNGFEGTLPSQLHFEYLIAHTAHHFLFRGAGIKLVLDLAAVILKCDVDTESAVLHLEKAGLGRFAKEILTVCYKWYGVGKDFGLNTDRTEDFLACYGAFGNVNRNNAAVLERRNMEDGNFGSAFSQRLMLLFPPYRKLKEIPYIKFIENRPYLTPYAWIYRFFYNIFHRQRRNYMLTAVKGMGSSASKQEALSELKYFEEIGLV